MSDPLTVSAFATLRIDESVPADVERFTSLSAFLERYPELDLTGKLTRGDVKAFGGHSDVYIGTYTDPTDNMSKKIAIKSIRIFIDRDKDFERAIVRELDIWRRLNHPNIHSLLGYARVDGLPSFISIWMDKSTVSRYIKGNDISMEEKYRIVKGISEGLCYLHDGGIVHSDLKTDNILINIDGLPILSDFGISRMLVESHTITGTKELKGSVRYMAIELFTGPRGLQHCLHTKATDVWAFGMISYEILSGNLPYHDSPPNEASLIKIITDGIVPKQTTALVGVDFVMRFLMENTWSRLPEDRPNMKEVNEALDVLLSWRSDSASSDTQDVSEKQEECIAKLLNGGIIMPVIPLTSIAAPKASTKTSPSLVPPSAMTPSLIPSTAVFSPDSSAIAVNFLYQMNLQVFSTQTGESLFGEMQGHQENITTMVFSKDGVYLASQGLFKGVLVWDAKVGTLVSQVQEPNLTQITVDFIHGADEAQLAINTGTSLSKYDPRTGKLVAKILARDLLDHTYRPTLSTQGDCILDWSEKNDNSFWLKYSSSGLKPGQIIPPAGPFSIHAVFVNARVTFRQVVFWDALKIVRYYTIAAVATFAEVWDMTKSSVKGDVAQLGPIRVDGQDKLQVSKNGQLAALFDLKGHVQFFSLLTGRPVCSPIKLHSSGIRSVSFSDDSTKFASVGMDGTIRIWDIRKVLGN